MIKRKSKIALFLTLIIVLMSSMTVFAEGTSSVSISSNNPTVGETFSSTVTCTESGTVTVKYNTAVLSVVNCNVSGYQAKGDSVVFQGKTGTITFKANAEGKSSISVSSDKCSGCSTNISVGSGSPQVANLEGDFVVNNQKMVISEKFSQNEILNGFNVIQKDIHGHSYKVLSNNSMILVYLKNIDNLDGSGAFYIYDESSDSVSELKYVGNPTYYLIIKEPTKLLSDKLKQSTIEVDGKSISVYKLDGVDEFVYLYGVGFRGIEQWFQYDTVDKTVQRVNMAAISSIANDDSDANKDEGNAILNFIKELDKRYLIGFAIFVAIVVIVIIINIIIKKRDNKADAIDGDESDFFQDEDLFDDKVELKKDELDSHDVNDNLSNNSNSNNVESKSSDLNNVEPNSFDSNYSEVNNNIGDTQVITLEEELKNNNIDFDKDEVEDSELKQRIKKIKPKKEKKERKGLFSKLDDFSDFDDDEEFMDDLESEEIDNQEGAAFWEDEKDIKRAKKRQAKEQKRNKNIFGDDEISIDDLPKKKNDNKKTESSVDVMDLNDL